MQTSLLEIAKKAKRSKTHRFQNLCGLLTEEYLRECWNSIKKNAATGVDKVSAREYERDLDENITNLVQRLKNGSYKAKLVRAHTGKYCSKPSHPYGLNGVSTKSRHTYALVSNAPLRNTPGALLSPTAGSPIPPVSVPGPINPEI